MPRNASQSFFARKRRKTIKSVFPSRLRREAENTSRGMKIALGQKRCFCSRAIGMKRNLLDWNVLRTFQSKIETDNPVFASIAKHGVILRFSVPSPKLLSGLWFSGVLPGLKRFHTHQSDSGAAGPACCRYASYIGPTSLSTSLTFYSNQRSLFLGKLCCSFVHLHYMPKVSGKSMDGLQETAAEILCRITEISFHIINSVVIIHIMLRIMRRCQPGGGRS